MPNRSIFTSRYASRGLIISAKLMLPDCFAVSTSVNSATTQ